MPVKTCCCVRDVLQGNKVVITVIIQRNLDTARNIDRFCQFEGSQFEFEHTLCIQLRPIFSFFIFTSIYCTITFGCISKCNADSSQCFGYCRPRPIAVDFCYMCCGTGRQFRCGICKQTCVVTDRCREGSCHVECLWPSFDYLVSFSLSFPLFIRVDLIDLNQRLKSI